MSASRGNTVFGIRRMVERSYDVIVLGSGIAGLSAALAAHAAGLNPLLLEKTSQLGGTTCDSYGLIWIGDNHVMRSAGRADQRDQIIDYMTFLGAGEISEPRMLALVDHGPQALKLFESCGIPFKLING